MFTTTLIAIQWAREALIDASYDLNLIYKLPSNLVCKLQAAHQKLHPFFSVLQLQLLIQNNLAIEMIDALVEFSTFFTFYNISANLQFKLIMNRDGINRYKETAAAFENLIKQNFNAESFNEILEKNGGDLALVYLSRNYDFFKANFREEEIIRLINYNDAHVSLTAIHENFDRLEKEFGVANIVKMASKPSNYLGMLSYLRYKTSLQEKSFTFSEVLTILLACDSSNLLEELLNQYNDLRKLGLTHLDICRISRYHGAISVYKVLKEHYTDLCKAGFTHAQIIAMACHSGGSKNLLAAIDAMASTIVTELRLTSNQVTALLNREAGKKFFTAFQDCYAPLTLLGFDLEQILEILSRRGGVKAAAAILACSDDIKSSQIELSIILKIVKNEERATCLKEFLMLYQSLIDLQVSPQSIADKLNNNFIEELRSLIEAIEDVKAIAQTESMPEFEMNIPILDDETSQREKPSAKRKKCVNVNYPSHRAAPLVKRNKISSNESESAAIQVMRRVLAEYDSGNIKEVKTQVSVSDAAILLALPKKKRDEMGFLSFHKYTSKKQDHQQYYPLKLNLPEYKAWEALRSIAYSEQSLITTEQIEEELVQDDVAAMSPLQNNMSISTPSLFSFNDNFGSTLFATITPGRDEDHLGLATDMQPVV